MKLNTNLKPKNGDHGKRRRHLPRRGYTFAILVALVAPPAGNSAEADRWSEGHGDLGINYVDGAWTWSARSGVAPESVLIELDQDAKNTIPVGNETFSFLGVAGEPIWIIPQVARDGVPFMGMNSNNTDNATFEIGRFDLALSSVTGPGDFIMWTTGGSGQVQVLMNSRDGIDEDDFTDVPAPGHFHQNWGFTSPGTHFVGYKAMGILAESGESTVSEEQLYQFAVNVLSKGKADIEVVYEDGEWELAILDEANDQEYAPNEAALHVGPETWTRVLDDGHDHDHDHDGVFLGHPGESIYILPQSEREGVLYLGIAGDEIETGAFENDAVTLQLTSIEGPGNVFLYATDAFGESTEFFNSADGISQDDAFPIAVGGHSHQSWAFSEPGIYRVGLTPSGVLADSGELISGDEGAFLFEVFAPELISEGELDIEVAYEDGAWEIVGLDEANEREICASDLVIQGGMGTQLTVPGDAAYAFLGEPGAMVHALPQEETEGVIFLGIAGDEIEAGVFQDDAVDLQLVNVEGPGNVSLYSVDAFGAPTVYFNSADGVSESDTFPISVGGHSHQNWGFSAPGIYKVGLQASGTFVDGGEFGESEVVEFTFELLETAGLGLDITFLDDSTLALSWPTIEGDIYQLQARDSFSAPGWTDMKDPITGTGDTIEIQVSIDSQALARFYQIEQTPSGD